jgi:hypothetical protein
MRARHLLMPAGIDTFVRPFLFVGEKEECEHAHLFMPARAHASRARAPPAFALIYLYVPFCV